MLKEIGVDKPDTIKIIFVEYFKIVAIVNIIAIFSLAYFLLLQPKYIEYKTAPEREKKSLEEELSKREADLEKLQGMKKSLNVFTEAKRKKLNDFLPQEKMAAELFVQLDALARDAKLHLDSMGVSESKMASDLQKDSGAEAKKTDGGGKEGKSQGKIWAGNVNEVQLNIAISGGHYFDLKNFLKEVERNLRLLDVLSVNFSGEGGLFQINMKTYYIREK